MWAPPGRSISEPDQYDIGDATLPPMTLEALLSVCRSYSEGAGLGWDQFHPRWILTLPLGYQLRFLAILQGFEDNPGWFLDMVTHIVFIPKPEGGVRPIGLLCLVAKIWSKLRQPMCRDWEKAHRMDFFWV